MFAWLGLAILLGAIGTSACGRWDGLETEESEEREVPMSKRYVWFLSGSEATERSEQPPCKPCGRLFVSRSALVRCYTFGQLGVLPAREEGNHESPPLGHFVSRMPFTSVQRVGGPAPR
jgi:hypothetical protein